MASLAIVAPPFARVAERWTGVWLRHGTCRRTRGACQYPRPEARANGGALARAALQLGAAYRRGDLRDLLVAVRARVSGGGDQRRRIEKPPYPFAHALRKLFRGPAHPPGKRQNGKARGYENEEIPLRGEEFYANPKWNKEQKPVHHHGSAPIRMNSQMFALSWASLLAARASVSFSL